MKIESLNIRVFFQENLWASILSLIILTLGVGVFMFFRIKDMLDELAEKYPESDFFGKIFGKLWGRLIPLLLFLLFILLSYFLTKLYK